MDSYNANNNALTICLLLCTRCYLPSASLSAYHCPLITHSARVEMLKMEVISAAIKFICDVRREEAEGREADWKKAQWWFVLKQGGG